MLAKLAQVVIQRLRMYTRLWLDSPITPREELQQELSSETICPKVFFTITVDANIHWIVTSERYLSTPTVMVVSCKRKTITFVSLNKTIAFKKTKVCYVSHLSSSHYQYSNCLGKQRLWSFFFLFLEGRARQEASQLVIASLATFPPKVPFILLKRQLRNETYLHKTVTNLYTNVIISIHNTQGETTQIFN